MKRVETLLQKLQQQISDKVPVNKLLLTVQMMQHELMHLQGNTPLETNEAITIAMPLHTITLQKNKESTTTEHIDEEKTIEILQIDEAEVEAELEEIKRNAGIIQNISSHNKPPMYFNAVEDDIPTLIHQEVAAVAKEVNERAGKEKQSVNETLKTFPTAEVSAKLSEGPVKDLKKAIGVNDRFVYINELFRGDDVMYERSIKTINSFSIWPEAEYWIRRELKTKLGWMDNTPIVKQFDQLVKRRFA